MVNPPGKPGQRPKIINRLLHDRSKNSLAQILAHAKELDRLDHILASVLDANLTSHCQVAEYRHQCLILLCSTATFATRIRMISQQLLDSFREEGEFGIERIEIRIAPVNRPQPEARKKRALSSAAVRALGRFTSDSGNTDIQAIFDKINARRNQ